MTVRTLQWLIDQLTNGNVSTASFPSGVDSNGNDVLEERGEAAVTPGFDSFRTPDADRPTLVVVEATVQTDGTSDGTVTFEVDTDGGTAADYTLTVANIPSDNTGGTATTGTIGGVTVPAGASYQVANASDPNAANSLDTVRETTL